MKSEKEDFMKIIASNMEGLLIDANEAWICVSPYSSKSEINKKENPLFLEASLQKWGYIPLKHSIEINDLSDITGEIYKTAKNNLKWKKDYIT